MTQQSRHRQDEFTETTGEDTLRDQPEGDATAHEAEVHSEKELEARRRARREFDVEAFFDNTPV